MVGGILKQAFTRGRKISSDFIFLFQLCVIFLQLIHAGSQEFAGLDSNFLAKFCTYFLHAWYDKTCSNSLYK